MLSCFVKPNLDFLLFSDFFNAIINFKMTLFETFYFDKLPCCNSIE